MNFVLAKCFPYPFCAILANIVPSRTRVWYKPLEKIDTAVVGKSTFYRYKDTILPVTWNRNTPSNNIFVGDFTM